LGTLAGAEALGCDEHVGSLRPGKRADLVAVPLPEGEDPYAFLGEAEGGVEQVFASGLHVFTDGSC
jgi:imidazolonepropionase-like amidohydrolase